MSSAFMSTAFLADAAVWVRRTGVISCLHFMQSFTTSFWGFSIRGLHSGGYLNKVLEWQLRSFYREEVKRKQCEWICERESIIDYEWNPTENDYCLKNKIHYLLTGTKLSGFRVAALRQRLHILLMKNVAFVREDEFLSLLPLLNLSRDKGLLQRECLLEGMKKKFERKNHLVMKRRENYYRFTLSEKKKFDCADPEKTPLA